MEDADSPQICPRCGTITEPGMGKLRGDLLIEIFLYIFFLLPGLLYSLWRRSPSGGLRCPNCAARLIRCDTPAGESLLGQYDRERLDLDLSDPDRLLNQYDPYDRDQ